ncbi:MAG: ion transporter [Planctomycetota bacterium]
MIQRVFEKQDRGPGRAVALSIQALIVASLVIFAVQTLPDLGDTVRHALQIAEVVIVAIFTVEYSLRVYAAEDRRGFIFSFFGLVDLVAILPFYLSLGLDLRTLRVVRLLRLFRILKLARYSVAMRRLHRAFLLAREELVLFLSATGIVLYLAAVGIYYFERDAQPDTFKSVFHSLWWAVVTLTTVGYGDAYPLTVGGRCFTFVVLVVGLGIVALPAGILASALSEARRMEGSTPEPVDDEPTPN